MLVVGERINTSRKRINKAVRERDAKFIQKEAKKQVEAGATMIDVNAGTSVEYEVDDLKWLVQVVQEAVDVPLCIDSPNPNALKAALPLHKGTALINSITAEKDRIENIIPLVKEFDALVVGLMMGGGGSSVATPSGVEDRIESARIIVDALDKNAIPLSRVYFDPAVFAVGLDQAQAQAVINTVGHVKTEYKDAHTIAGVSNISHQLPNRNCLNCTFLALMVAAGLDAVIIDPTQANMMSTLYATNVLLGKDDFCQEYIRAFREGRLR